MPACPSCPAGSGTPAHGPPTGTFQQMPGCWPWPRGEWPASAGSIRPAGPRSRDGQPRPGLAAVLHRPDDHPEACQPAHHPLVRDTFRLLLSYAQQATGTPPWKPELRQLDAKLITGFLQHLQHQRRNSARTRNARLAAIRTLYRYAALHAPEDAEVIQQVLAIDGSRTSTTLVTWLNAAESTALLAAAGSRGSWTGRRDHAMLLVLLRTGLRVSELTQLNRGDVHLGAGAHVRCLGKGRKERCTPLDEQAVTVLQDWLATTSGHDSGPLFPSNRQGRLTRDAVAARLARYHQIASQECPSLAAKPSPRTRSATPWPWSCGAPELTSPFSRYGSAIPISGQPRSTSTPTCKPRNARSRSPARPHPGRTLPAIRPPAGLPRKSLTPSSYAAFTRPASPACQGIQRRVRITPNSA